MMKRMFMVLVLLIPAGPVFSAGPGFDALSNRIDARTFRQESRVAGREIRMAIGAAAEAEPAVKWDLSLGVGYTDGQDGSKTTSTPFLLKATFNDKKTSAKLTGDGFAHAKTDTGTSSGLSDVTASLAQVLYSRKADYGTSRLVGEVGYTIPSHGEVGSTKGKERVGLAYSGSLSQTWDVLVSGKLTRFDADPAAGTSRVARSVVGQATYNFLDSPGSDIVLALARSYRPGAGGATQASATYDFPMTAQKEKGPIGSLGFARGLTSGAHDNSVEFDVSLSF